MRSWIKEAWELPVRKRALKYALIVGFILIAINYSDVIIKGELTALSLLKMSLTVFVPYVVSTFSSVAAVREMEDKNNIE